MRAAAFLILLLLAGCETPSISAQRRWTRDNVSGLEMTLIDPVRIEYLGFGPTGMAAYTLGRKGPNGYSVAPAGDWRIVKGKLCIFHDADLVEELTLISCDRSTLTARSHFQKGRIVRFKIHEGKI